MGQLVDNLITLRILKLLTTPFNKMKAYELGLIDEDGNRIKAHKDMSTAERNEFTLLHRLVFRLKRLLAKVPGGRSQLGSYIAALALIKEQYEKGEDFKDDTLLESVLYDGEVLQEDIANVTGGGVSTDVPVVRRKRKRQQRVFEVSPETFKKFKKGKKKYAKWSNYLQLDDENESKIYKYAKNYPDGIITLKNSETGETKSIRFNSRGGGRWRKVARNYKKIEEAVQNRSGATLEYDDGLELTVSLATAVDFKKMVERADETLKEELTLALDDYENTLELLD
jgi:hypothetical protein